MKATSPEFIINIIVRARNEIAGVMERAARDVDKLSGAQERSEAAGRRVVKNHEDTKRSVSELQKAYSGFVKDVEKGNVSYDDATFHLKRFQAEFAKLARSSPVGSEQAASLNRAAEAAKNLQGELVYVQEAHAKLAKAAEAEQDIREKNRISRMQDDKKAADESVRLEQQATQRRQAFVNDLLATVRKDHAEQLKIDKDLADYEVAEAARVEAARAAHRQGRVEAEVAAAKRVADAQSRVIAKEIEDRGRAEEATRRQTSSQRDLRSELVASTRAYDDFIDRMRQGEVTGESVRTGLQQHASHLQSLSGRATRTFGPGSDESLMIGNKAQEARSDLASLRAEMSKSETAADRLHGAMARMFGQDPEKLKRIEDRIASFNQRLTSGRFNVAAFDNRLRGLIYVGIFAFFQQLVGVVGALAGALVELAGAAIQAGSALAGMAAAGAAQALPMFGLLAAAWGRVGAVFKAVQQAQKAQAQAGYDHTEQLNKQIAATEAVTNAQKALDKARFDARRNLEDLIDAERRAQLQAEAAVLAQDDSRRALASSIASGDVAGRAKAELDVRQADLGVTEAVTTRQRAVQDANTARSQGIEKNPNVVAAKQALEDARRSAADTQKQMLATQRTLQQLLAQLDPTERKLFETIRNLQADYKKVFRPITDIIVGSFTDAVDRVDKLLKDNRILSTARTMANAISDQIRRITAFLTTDKNISFFQRMGAEASRNLPKVVTIFENLYKVFRNFATAASPALSKFLDFLGALSSQAANATSGDAGLAKLSKFFAQGEQYAEGMIHLGIAIGKLILAITGQSAQQGFSLLDSITNKINEATNWINAHKTDVQNFFAQAREATGYIADAIWQLTKALFGLFHVGQVKAFAAAFTNTLLPTLERVLKAMGTITGVFLKFAGSAPGSALLQFVLTSTLLFKAFSPLISLFAKGAIELGTLFGRERLVASGLAALELSTSTWGKALAAIVALVLLLNDRLKNLPSLLKLVAVALGAVAVYFIGSRGLAGPIRGVIGLLETMASASLAGRFGALGIALGGILTKVIGLLRNLPGLNRLLATTADREAVVGVESAAASLPGARGAAGAAGRGGPAVVPILRGRGRRGAGAGAGAAGAEEEAAAKGGLRSALGRGVGVLTVATVAGSLLPLKQSTALPDHNHGLLGETGIVGGNLLKNLGNFNIGGAFKNLFGGRSELETFSKGFADNFKALTDQHNVKGLQDLASKARDLAKDWPQFSDALKQSADQADNAAKHFVDVRKAMGALGSEADSFKAHALNASDVVNPNAVAQFLSNLSRMRTTGFRSIKDLRDNIEFNLEAINTGFAAGSHSWAEAIKDNANRAIRELSNAMDSGKLSVKQGTKEMQRVANQNLTQLRDNMANLSDEGRQALADNAFKAASAMEAQMKRAGNVTKDGMERIQKLMTQALVNGYGFTQEQALNIAKTGNIEGQRAGTGNEGGGDITRAVGGWIGRQGERGRDLVRTALGRGEAVLNWAHQRVVEPALQKTYGFGLNTMFKKIRGEHAGGAVGMAGGGFVNNVGAHVDTATEKRIANGLDKLGKALGITFSPVGARSARRTNTESVEVGGYAGDPHTKGIAMDVAPDAIKTVAQKMLSRFGLWRPMQTWNGRDERNHIQLLASAAQNAITSVATTGADSTAEIIKRITGIKVGGPQSALRTTMQRAIGRVIAGANRRLRQAADIGGGDGGPSLGVGGDAARNVALGKKMAAAAYHWVGAQWQALKKLWTGESGWRKNINSGGATGPWDGVHAYGIPQALPPTKMASAGADWMNSAGTQIKWGLKYIHDTYGSPISALSKWLSRSPHWYETGGSVPGRGPMPIVAHGGEHVWTESEVKAAGGHGVMHMLRRLVGGGGQGGPKQYAQGGRVLMIGDSLGVGVQPYLERSIKKLDAFNKVGRSSEEAVGLLKDKLSKAYKQVIFDVGTNDASARAFAVSLRKAYRMVGADRSLVVSTVEGPHAAAKNAVLRRFAAAHGNVSINDWASHDQGLIGPDGIHATSAGYRARARMLARTARTGGATGPAFTLPTIFDTSIGGLQDQAKRAQGFISKLSTKSKKFLTSFDTAFRELAADGGIFDQLSTAIDTLTNRLTTSLGLATYKVDKAGNVIQKLDAAAVAQKQVDNLERTYKALAGERGTIARDLEGITKRIEDLRKGGISSNERKTYEVLVGYRRAIQKRLDDVKSNIADNLSQTYQAVENAVAARVDAVSTAAGQRTTGLDLQQRGRALLGGTLVTALGGPTNTALGRQRAGILTEQATALTNIAKSTPPGHKDAVNAILAQVQDLRMQALEAVQTGISADVDEVNRQAQRKSTALDIKSRIASALGQTSVVADIFTSRIKDANDQITALKDQKAAADANGLGSLSEQIQDQINDLNASITEYATQQLDSIVSAIDDQASRQATTFGIRNRLADLMTKAGDPVAAAKAATAALVQQGSDFQGQLSQYSNALQSAISLGDTAQINSLNDKITELQTAIAENTQAIKDSPVRERQALLDVLTGRGNFLGGVYGGLGGLVTAIGAITGTTDVGAQKGLLGQSINTLRQTGTGLRQQLFEGYGVNTVGANPNQLVSILSKLNYDGIEANFDQAQKEQFESLINAVIENATAIESNTDQLNQLNAPTTQGWSTTAWQWFRNAVFNGAGGLLSQYQIPSMDTGGSILTNGMIHVHSGERVVAANVSRDGGSYGEPSVFAPSFAVTEQVEEADPQVLANRMLWAYRNRPKGS